MWEVKLSTRIDRHRVDARENEPLCIAQWDRRELLGFCGRANYREWEEIGLSGSISGSAHFI